MRLAGPIPCSGPIKDSSRGPHRQGYFYFMQRTEVHDRILKH